MNRWPDRSAANSSRPRPNRESMSTTPFMTLYAKSDDITKTCPRTDLEPLHMVRIRQARRWRWVTKMKVLGAAANVWSCRKGLGYSAHHIPGAACSLDAKDFELILVNADTGVAIGGRLGLGEFAEEFSTGTWEAKMHRHQGRCSKILFTLQRFHGLLSAAFKPVSGVRCMSSDHQHAFS